MPIRIPVLAGVIRRRMLVNFRAHPDTVQALLPAPFRPKLQNGHAIVGICLIRLEQIRPKFLPSAFGLASENAAHRIAVEWDEGSVMREGVYIPRRDTGSWLNRLAGGRLFPGEHFPAVFEVQSTSDQIKFKMNSSDGLKVHFQAQVVDQLPPGSCFRDVAEASRFFETGSIGFSPRSRSSQLDGLVLETKVWNVKPLELTDVHSSWFANPGRFPSGTIEFDHALLMCDIPHEWRSAEAPACPCANPQ